MSRVAQKPEEAVEKTLPEFDRRSFLQMLASGAAALSVGEAFAEAPKGKPLNFLYVIVDDLGWSDTSPYGNKVIDTPNLERLAREGARFTNAYASCPVCSPSRASVMTGKYPARIGLTDFIPGSPQRTTSKLITPKFTQEIPIDEVTIAKLVKPKRYASANIGKWHLGGEGFSPTDQGFDVNIGGDDRGHPARYFGPETFPNMDLGPGEFLTERVTEEGVQYLGRMKDQPFFLYEAHYAVHGPIQAKPADVEKYRKRDTGVIDPVYCAMVESVDVSIGKLLDAVEASGMADRTVIFFTADHGGLMYRENTTKPVTTNAPLRAGKGHLFEGGVRIPLYVKWPGVTKPGAVVDTQVCNVDVVPTLCAVLGLPVPANVDGVNMLPALRGKALPTRPLFWHYPHYSPQGGTPSGAVRLGDWKLIEFYEDGRLELYNLAEDLGERRNLVEREKARAREMHEMLVAWRTGLHAKMPTPNPMYDPAKGDRPHAGYEPPTPPVA